MEAWTQKEINNCIEACKQKAAVDKKFRTLIMNNPAEAVKEVCNKDIPSGIKLKIIEADPAFDATFVLPPMVSGSISDDALDSVAAGICVIDQCAMKACAADGPCAAKKSV